MGHMSQIKALKNIKKPLMEIDLPGGPIQTRYVRDSNATQSGSWLFRSKYEISYYNKIVILTSILMQIFEISW